MFVFLKTNQHGKHVPKQICELPLAYNKSLLPDPKPDLKQIKFALSKSFSRCCLV